MHTDEGILTLPGESTFLAVRPSRRVNARSFKNRALLCAVDMAKKFDSENVSRLRGVYYELCFPQRIIES